MKRATVASVLSVCCAACLSLLSPDVRGTSQQLQQEMSPQAMKRLIHFHTERDQNKTCRRTHTHRLIQKRASGWRSTVRGVMLKVSWGQTYFINVNGYSLQTVQYFCVFLTVLMCLSFLQDSSILRKLCVWVMACQPASLPATAPAPEPAGTFALWLQFPGMPNLRQLLRTWYLCQQCASSAQHITRHSVSIWNARLDLCAFVCQQLTVSLALPTSAFASVCVDALPLTCGVYTVDVNV